MEDKSGSLVGVNQLVHRNDGSWHLAKLIQKRENPDTHDTEYYVHYDGCKLPASDSRKITLCLARVNSE